MTTHPTGGITSKTYHYAKMINNRGDVSALCYKEPRKIDFSKQSWSNRIEAVTCKKCLEMLKENTDV